MSSAERHPLAPSDLAMLDGVLRRAGFHQHVDRDDQDSLRLAAVFLIRRFQAGVTAADALLSELQRRNGLRTPRQIETANLEQWENDGGAPQRHSVVTCYTSARRLPQSEATPAQGPAPPAGKGVKSG